MRVRDLRQTIPGGDSALVRFKVASLALAFLASVWMASLIQAEESAGVLPSRWVTSLPSVAIAAEHTVIEPVAVRTRSGSLLVAAESVGKNESTIVLSRSTDQGTTWRRETRNLVQAKDGYRVSAGAAGMLPSGRLVLACHEWQEKPGTVEHVREEPAGVHHYQWSGFQRASVLKVFLSDDDGATWTSAVTNVSGGPVATAAMGTVFAANGTDWFPVYGPSDDKQTNAALSGIGLMRSDDDGQSWKFSHWIAKADEAHNIGYGPGDVTVLPDGRWLGLLQGNYRGLGDYTRPRVCRTISSDAGRTWSLPEQKFLNHGTSTVTLDGRDGEEIMVGGWKDRGIHFTVGANAGEDWLYQDQVWWCIWYGVGNRGGARLLKLDEGVLAVYHWMDDKDLSRTQVRAQMIRRATGPAPETDCPKVEKLKPQSQWRMAEAYQLPPIPDAPAGIRIKTLLKLRSGEWICLGYVGSKKADTAYGFAPTGLCALRSAKITGPWKKIADIPMPPEVGGLFDTGTGAGTPGAMMRHSSGRLFLPLSASNRKDIILTYSDDEGRTWRTIGSMARITGLPAVHEANKIVERKDGSLVFPLQRPFHGESKQHPLFYVRSRDKGETWTAPVFWATHPGTRYEGLPHGSFADLRETSLAMLNDHDWLGLFRESRGTQSPENAERGPLSMPFLCLARSTDDGRTWKSSFGFLGVEPDIEGLPGGAVMATFRDDNLASVWISYDKGVSWQIQHDPAELPWRKGAAELSTQWPPGGEPIIRVIDDHTVAVICDSGMIPSGKLLPPDYKLSKEFQGRVQVRFFRREPAAVPYPDPGYRFLGVYGGGDDRYFDYHLGKLSLGDTFPDKAAWWAGMKASHAGRDDAHRHDVLIVYCGERDADLETGKRRLDAWLAAEKDCPTYPELIPAICLGEENTGGRVEVLDGLARYVREKYGIPVFQWYTDPFPPDPNLTADGWIWDSYGWDRVRFRKHLMKFVALGKPAICVPWATDPHWPQYTQYPTTEALINKEWHQFDTSREFNVSCAAFAVAGPTGSVNHWMGSETTDMVQLRAALQLKREEMHDTRPGTLPLSSANFSARDRGVPVGGDRDAPSVYEESFSGFQWLHDADVRGFLGLQLTSRPEEPGFLTLKTKSGETSRASLVYRFESYFPLESVEVTLDAVAPSDARCRNTLAISTDELGRDWSLEVTQHSADKIDSLRLRDEGSLKGKHVFFVRVSMENAAQQAGLAGNRLDRLRVRCEHQPPPANAAAKLSSDLYGNLTYEDDFTTKRWQHLGRLDVGHPSHGGYRDQGFWVGMKDGFATSTHLVQRISSPQPLKQLVVTADCSANGPDLGGSITLSVGPRGEKPKWDVQTQGVHNGPLKLEVPAGELGSLQDFDVHMTLHSSSGVENGDKACATLSGLSIQAKGG